MFQTELVVFEPTTTLEIIDCAAHFKFEVASVSVSNLCLGIICNKSGHGMVSW